MSQLDWKAEYAYTTGMQAFIYGFPYIYNAKLRHDWVTQARDPAVIPYAAVNHFDLPGRRLPEQRHPVLAGVAGSGRRTGHLITRPAHDRQPRAAGRGQAAELAARARERAVQPHSPGLRAARSVPAVVRCVRWACTGRHLDVAGQVRDRNDTDRSDRADAIQGTTEGRIGRFTGEPSRV